HEREREVYKEEPGVYEQSIRRADVGPEASGGAVRAGAPQVGSAPMTGPCHDRHRPIKRGALFPILGIVAFTGLLLGARAASATNSVTDVSDPSTYSCVQPGFLTFEDLMDGTGLGSGTITGVEFTTPMFTWLVGDFDTGLYNGKYPSGGYTSQGTHWTWIGPDQGSGDIRFVYGPASVFSLLVSAHSRTFP